jgi:hypothetical protein
LEGKLLGDSGMLYFFLFILALYAGVFNYYLSKKYWVRIQKLEQELQGITGMMSQMMETQMQAFRKYSTNIENLEERMMELSVPSHDPNLPLERRHQVLALARQGVSLEDIVKRLKAPTGEAELILNLGKYMSSNAPQNAKINQQVGDYA